MIRNDFLCLGAKCRTPEGATLYADLPSDTRYCPVCRSKRVQKIFSANVATRGVAPFVDRALEQSGLREQLEARDRRLAVETKDAHDRPRPGDAVVAGFAGNMGALMAKATAPWATGPNGHNPFGGASAGPRKSASLGEGVVLGQRLPAGGVRLPGSSMKLTGGARPTAESLSDGKGRPTV